MSPEAGRTDLYYSFELHKNNTIQVVSVGADGQTYYGLGVWSLNGSIFSAHIKKTYFNQVGTPQAITGTYDSTNNKLSGIVVNDIGSF